MISDILKGWANRLATALLGSVIGWLVNSGVATRVEVELVIIAAVGLLVSLGQSTYKRLMNRWHLERALKLPQGSSVDKLLAVSDATPKLVKIGEAITGEQVITQAQEAHIE